MFFIINNQNNDFIKVRINLLNTHDKLNQISDESLKSEDEYETCINLLKELNEKSKVSTLALVFFCLFVIIFKRMSLNFLLKKT